MTCVYLNLTQANSPEPWQAKPEPRQRPMGPGVASILIADDSDTVLEVTSRVLIDAGYDVVTARDGVAALDIIASQPAVDLLITDIRMPRMGGHALVQQILSRRPDLPIIYITGYSADWNPRDAVGGAHIFLQKPFQMEELVLAVEKLLRD